MNRYTEMRDPPPNRRGCCDGGLEQHFAEGAVMIAFAMYLLEQGALEVEVHPDGEHGKRYDMSGCLSEHGFTFMRGKGRTSYGGIYQRGHQRLVISCKPGLGDVVAKLGESRLVAECKGGIINTSHAGQVSRLRRGLCEVVGLLMTRILDGERHVAVVPSTRTTENLGLKMLPRAQKAGIEIALLDQHGNVNFLSRPS